ncbi:MAG: threonine synthase [Halobacteriales archaeon]
MMTGSVVTHIKCRGCGETYGLDLTEYPCRACGGILDPQYDLGAVDVSREEIEGRSGSMWIYRELLPIQESAAVVSMGEGDTPLIECPTLADRLGVRRLLVKDEGQNPTNTFKDRGQATAMSAAVEREATAVGLPSAGNAGQAASAYAARAGLPCHVFLNPQAGEVKKDLVRAHGADLHLVDGKITDAGAAFNGARAENGWHSVATFQTPFRHEGKKTMGHEIFADLGWETPDEIVYPTGGGVGLIGIWKAYRELSELGWVDGGAPRLTVAQSEGAAPVVEAIRERRERHEPWVSPDSIAKGVEIPDPGASPWMLEAVFESDGAGVAVTDTEAVDAALEMARADGVEMCVTSAVAMAGAMARADEGAYGTDETLVVINTGAGCKTHARLGDRAREQEH